jgi:hypothetical protein
MEVSYNKWFVLKIELESWSFRARFIAALRLGWIGSVEGFLLSRRGKHPDSTVEVKPESLGIQSFRAMRTGHFLECESAWFAPIGAANGK